MIYYFPQHVPYFILLLACSQFRCMFFHACLHVICLDLHALCFMPCFPMLCSSFLFYVDVRVTCSHACMMLLAMPYLDLCVDVCISMLYGQILVFTCLYAWIHVLPCLCARLVHVDVYVSLPTCLDLCFHMLVCLDLYSLHALYYLPCLCDQTQAMFVMPCAIVALLFLLSCFLVFWPISLDPIQTLWSLSSSIHQGPLQKGLDCSYLHVYACLLLCFMLMLVFLVLGFAMLDALSEFLVAWLHSTSMRHFLDETIWDASP